MSKVFLISDLHLGHKKIMDFTKDYRTGVDYKENAEILLKNWNKVVGKRDLVWVLGDVCFDSSFLAYLSKMKGQKNLILGNHDISFSYETLSQFFSNIYGIIQYKGYWLTHAPIHPTELRNKINIHGHVHQHTLNDKRYVNVCVENINETPISFDKIKFNHHQ